MLEQVESQPVLIDQVYDRLVAAISSGRLVPGEHLTQEGLADMLGVSRQPVSHALKLLRHRGLVVERGRRGVMVAPIDRVRIRQLYEVREALDGLSARLAAQRVRQAQASPEDVQVLNAALAVGDALEDGAEILDWVEADVAFHRAVHNLSGNPEIETTVAEQWPQFMRSMAVVLGDETRKQRIWREHTAIVRAIVDGNPETAEKHARAHTRRAGRDAGRHMTENSAAR
ncbi:MAG: GntR family transcriptional regulator [Pseudomonadota bacterium]